MDQFPGPLAHAEAWGPDPDAVEHRKQFEGELSVDFLPVGQSAEAKTSVTWPESGHSMSVVGFDLAFKRQSEVAIGPGVKVKVVDLPVVLLLKMIAFLDRSAQRQRDLTDIVSVLK